LWEPFLSENRFVNEYIIRVVDGPHKGLEVKLEGEVTTVGRDPFLHVPLTKDPQSSTLHCEIFLDPRGVRIRDAGSLNGLFIGKHRILDGFLHPGAKFRVGESILQLKQLNSTTALRIDFYDDSGQLVGKSPEMRRLFSLMSRLKHHTLSVLLTGETGTGKTSVARALHQQSDRSKGPFVDVNCAAVPGELLESEFFGHEPGAFTGAGPKARKGYFEQAHKGTLFLDEIGELPLGLQAKLLYAIEEKKIRRIGGNKDIKVDVRIVTATHRNLKEAIKAREFREDLYFRLAVVELTIPPLRSRIEDLPLLYEMLLSQISPSRRIYISPTAEKKLQSYAWPGNIRELRNVLERTVAFLEFPMIDAKDLELSSYQDISALPASPMVSETSPSEVSKALPITAEQSTSFPKPKKLMPLKQLVEEAEKWAVEEALKQAGSASKAAELLEVHRSWIYTLIKRYQLKTKKK